VVPYFSIASIRVGPIPDANPEIGQVLRIDAEVSVAAKIQQDGAIVELAEVSMRAEKIRWRDCGFCACLGGWSLSLPCWHATLHGIASYGRFAADAANRRLLKERLS